MKFFVTAASLSVLAAQESITIRTQDGASIAADLYGAGTKGVVLAHGGRRTKSDWAPQARQLAAAGFRVLAFDFRGFGKSPVGPKTPADDDDFRFDVLAAVRYLRQHGAQTVSVVGGSFGGEAAAEASVEAAAGEIDRLVLLAHGSTKEPEKMKGRKLFIVSTTTAMAADRGCPGSALISPRRLNQSGW